MHLLVSVASATEAAAALAGGADVIDAKDPLGGALGPVRPEVLRAIHRAVGGARPVTAALGDAEDESAIERAARSCAGAGAVMIKVGFGGRSSAARVSSLLSAAVRGARAEGAGVVAVAYADAPPATSLDRAAFVDAAVAAGAHGLLLDTANKDGPGLGGLVSPEALAVFVTAAHAAGLFVALAGKLSADDLPLARDAGADIAGVRGAACEGGRTGRVTADRVRRLCAAVRSGPARRWDDLKISPSTWFVARHGLQDILRPGRAGQHE